jgi:hypothetical protein
VRARVARARASHGATAPRVFRRASRSVVDRRERMRGLSTAVAGGVAGRDDRAEVLRVEPAGLPFGQRGGRVRGDADAGFAVVRVEDVGAVAGRRHPGIDDRLRARQPQRAPGDVLADFVPHSRAIDVAARADPVQRRFAIGSDVREVVRAGHVFAVALRGARELCVGRQCALAVRFAFLVDQAEDRRADQAEVVRSRRQAGVRTGAGGAGAHRGSVGCGCRARGRQRGGRGGRDLRDQEDDRETQQDGDDARRCGTGACHVAASAL